MAHHLGKECLPDFSSRYSRHDFTLPQLFACLTLREHQRLSYRDLVALLQDSPEWRLAIGMTKVPAVSTFCAAFGVLTLGRSLTPMLDAITRWMRERRHLGKTIAIDSTLMDVHYRSRHYEQRCRHRSTSEKRSANARRFRSARRTPKLTIAVDTRSHFVLAHRPRAGMGSDAPDFAPTLRAALERNRGAERVLADAGFDSHDNHRIAREELGVRSLIKTGIGRPSSTPPASKYRRQMKCELAGPQS
ncbi:MAG: transposase, partial [Burkholderiales bacterium]|nr:transposase [Phycisphaerae bacterium]